MLIPNNWNSILSSEIQKSYFLDLQKFIYSEYSQKECFPEQKNIFRAMEITGFDDIRVVILGQDPYHTPLAAMWLSFSVPDGYRAQPSLRNIFKELESDIGIKRTQTDLTDWAEQGILLLNSVLTVRSWEPGSHADRWWESFTDYIIQSISSRRDRVVFILWGNYAISKESLIDTERHLVIKWVHPSPFSAYRGFFGSKPFSKTNDYLIQNSIDPIVWA